MNRRAKVTALILSRRNVGEADRLVTLFTREFGLWKAIAKGVRRIPSRRGGHLEPFTRVVAIVSGTKAGRFIAAVETADHYPDLQNNEEVFAHARALAMIVTGLFEEEQGQPQLYDAIDHAWQMLPELPFPKRALLEAAVALHSLRLAGLMPDLSACGQCGETKPNEAVVFDATHGGWHCLLCHAGFPGAANSLSPRLLPLWRFLAAKPQQALRVRLTEEEAAQLLHAVRLYISHVTSKPIAALTSPSPALSFNSFRS
jgi:DNA repair protein RecO (recombination protein O)